MINEGVYGSRLNLNELSIIPRNKSVNDSKKMLISLQMIELNYSIINKPSETCFSFHKDDKY